jgi:anti-sigma regulatory factor (Ser/Thr protein kinase)
MTAAFPVLSSPDGPLARYVQVFAGTTASVAAARRFTSAVLAACPAREALVACVSELAANAVVHTASGDGGVFTVEVTRPRDGIARVAVTDAGSLSAPAVTAVVVPETAQAGAARTDDDWSEDWAADGADGVGRGLAMVADLADMDAEGGRGLALVAALAHSWGYRDVPPPRCAVPDDVSPSIPAPSIPAPSAQELSAQELSAQEFSAPDSGTPVAVGAAIISRDLSSLDITRPVPGEPAIANPDLSGRATASPASGRTVWAEACWPVGVPDSSPH